MQALFYYSPYEIKLLLPSTYTTIQYIYFLQVLSGWNAYLISNFLPRGPYENTPEEASKCSWRALVAKHGKKNDETVNLTRSKGFIPTFYRSTSPLLLESDTYVDTQGWGKGILMVLYNKATHIDDINLGRSVITFICYVLKFCVGLLGRQKYLKFRSIWLAIIQGKN